MNILIPYSWIKEFLITDASPEQVFKLMTATGPTIERIKKIGDDLLLDIEVTINRPDCLSVLGIAREMYAALKQNNYPAKIANDYLSNPDHLNFPRKKVGFQFKIDSQLCPRFSAIVLSNIHIKPSPSFIVERLEKSGIRSLNNVIDITNYLMLESGQPNHAFDFNKINGPDFIIRSALRGEKMVTLDNQQRKLEKGDLVYQDRDRIFDLSGIMGGKTSEIDSSTTKVLFTVVNDYYAQIRKTAMRLGIQTEASCRLSKVMNPEVVEPVMKKGVQMLVKYADAKIETEIFDHYPCKQKYPKISISNWDVENLLGIKINSKTIDQILVSLGFSVERNGDHFIAIPPRWRINDIALPADIIEEISRIYNYDLIPVTPPAFELPILDSNEKKIFLLENQIRNILTGLVYQETLSFSMLSQHDLDNINHPLNKAIKIANPLSSDWVYMQPTLLPNLLKNIQVNQYENPKILFFEIANVFDKKGKETRHLIFGGKINYSNFKGTIEQFFSSLRINNFQIEPDKEISNIASFGQRILFKNQKIGVFGTVREEISCCFEINNDILFCELDLNLLNNIAFSEIVFKPLDRFNTLYEEYTLTIPDKVSYQALKTVIEAVPGVKSLEYLTQYQQRISIKIGYYNSYKQITNKEAKEIRDVMFKQLKIKLGVELTGLTTPPVKKE